MKKLKEYLKNFCDGFLLGVAFAFCVSLPIIYFYLIVLRW